MKRRETCSGKPLPTKQRRVSTNNHVSSTISPIASDKTSQDIDETKTKHNNDDDGKVIPKTRTY